MMELDAKGKMIDGNGAGLAVAKIGRSDLLVHMTPEQAFAFVGCYTTVTVVDKSNEPPPIPQPKHQLTFFGLPVVVDETMAKDEIHFRAENGELVAKLFNLAIPSNFAGVDR
jgi:hypothetical protein